MSQRSGRTFLLSLSAGLVASATVALAFDHLGGPESVLATAQSVADVLSPEQQRNLLTFVVFGTVMFGLFRRLNAWIYSDPFFSLNVDHPERRCAARPPDRVYWRGFVLTGDDGTAWPVEFGESDGSVRSYAYAYDHLCWFCCAVLDVESRQGAFGLFSRDVWVCTGCDSTYPTEAALHDYKTSVERLCENKVDEALARGSNTVLKECGNIVTETWEPPTEGNEEKWWFKDVDEEELADRATAEGEETVK